jgi:hypothetical protein
VSTLRERIREWLRPQAAGVDESLGVAVRRAQFLMIRAAEAGRVVPPATASVIDAAGKLAASGALTGPAEQEFFAAYGQLQALTADLSKRPRTRREYPFEEALEDSELLLKYAAESGMPIQAEVSSAVLGARTALKANNITDPIRADFYANYAKLSKELGEVTAQTIRSCSLPATRRRLNRDQCLAITLAILVAIVSVITFVGDSRSKLITENIALENTLASKLRAALTPNTDTQVPDPKYADDPCAHLADPPLATEPVVENVADIEQLQQFAAVMRELRSRSIKLNELVWSIPVLRSYECDPFMGKSPHQEICPDIPRQPAELDHALQLNPGLINYTAEVLCKIRSYQAIRDFANNVNANYIAFVGGFTSFALPILYALLGAYAFRLRLFGDTIRKQTYHPSYADSARTITAVIAGAICGLFNPAQGMSLSPLAVAFLVGYGVEIFFRVLDNLTSAFGAGTSPRSTK